MSNPELLVSVCCITYNHGRFIAQAMESFLMQETDFQFEIVIGNDSSTDETLEVLDPFLKKYPGKIKLISTEKNVGSHHNLINTLAQCKGKYIALCEGDDYWTDPHKLQKQVDFLENNPDYIICCHYTHVVDEDSNTIYVNHNPVPLIYTYHDLLAGKQEETKTATLLYRNVAEVHELFDRAWFFNCHAGDKMFKLFATHHTGRKIYVLPEVMSCYRNHSGGVWSMINTNVRKEKMISDFNIIIKNFTYPALQKKKLLLLYVKRYLLFELRRMQVRKAYDTVKYLL
ncbi:glycosyltransferase family 2 protein [Mucilaginibacter sp. SP1R1]|uniref:glycosyltransferase family 2 protein n=1 Tax=Mucilaginibacter sp. SP1R1 TaxID=2723091 RepID=UPI00161FDEC9|nr:glycosyltransferase [Mucilaginibacter sp. SP1R1]MBB6151134.1 glycosyltransferase involved in cell wall biosynthesis [Mucilaginibacter sp. SP1R1]